MNGGDAWRTRKASAQLLWMNLSPPECAMRKKPETPVEGDVGGAEGDAEGDKTRGRMPRHGSFHAHARTGSGTEIHRLAHAENIPEHIAAKGIHGAEAILTHGIGATRTVLWLTAVSLDGPATTVAGAIRFRALRAFLSPWTRTALGMVLADTFLARIVLTEHSGFGIAADRLIRGGTPTHTRTSLKGLLAAYAIPGDIAAKRIRATDTGLALRERRAARRRESLTAIESRVPCAIAMRSARTVKSRICRAEEIPAGLTAKRVQSAHTGLTPRLRTAGTRIALAAIPGTQRTTADRITVLKGNQRACGIPEHLTAKRVVRADTAGAIRILTGGVLPFDATILIGFLAASPTKETAQFRAFVRPALRATARIERTCACLTFAAAAAPLRRRNTPRNRGIAAFDGQARIISHARGAVEHDMHRLERNRVKRDA